MIDYAIQFIPDIDFSSAMVVYPDVVCPGVVLAEDLANKFLFSFTETDHGNQEEKET